MTVPQHILDMMQSGDIYRCDDEEMLAAQSAQMELLYDFNATRPNEMDRRLTLMRRVLGFAGDGAYIEPPLHANWGCNTSVGNRFYANFNLTLVDDGTITIGDDVMIGPNVTIVTTGHPIRPDLRRSDTVTQFSLPVSIHDGVWIGAGVTILPGVTIGENSVIGAHSLVTKDVPDNVVAYGNPCRVVREIGEHDDVYYWRDRRISPPFDVKRE